MSAKTDIFVHITSKCPICLRELTNRYIKSKMFTAVEVEDDHFVRKYRCELPAFNNLRPEYYHLWMCPYCYFSDEKEVFRGEDDCGGKVEILEEKLLIETRRPDSVVKRLGPLSDLQAEFVSWSSALAAHLAAIYIQEILSPNMRQSGKLARLYLRTAWLYRERDHPEVYESHVIPDPELVEALEDVKKTWSEGPFDETTAMNAALQYYKIELENAGRTDNIRQEISIMFLLVSLYLRLGEKRTAMDYVRMIFRQCTQRRGSCRKALEGAARRDDVSSKQIEQLKTLYQWLNNTIDRTVALSEKLADLIFCDEYPRAREIVLAMGSPTPEEILERLRAEGCYEGTCRRVASIYKKKLLEHQIDTLAEAESDTGRAEEPGGLMSKIKGMMGKDKKE
ncbi:MAG: DUF2225 domain-containing protein [Planctomycetota bacterium]